MIRLALIVLLTLGLWQSSQLSFRQWTTGGACPLLVVLPACYVALSGYLLMSCAVLLRMLQVAGPAAWMFWTGWALACGLALLGSSLELVRGNVCPQAFGWLPMCYLSLGFCIILAVLFVAMLREKQVRV